MLVPSLDGPKNPTMDDVKRAADEYNRMGERAVSAVIVHLSASNGLSVCTIKLRGLYVDFGLTSRGL
jgi:hypothetical protein